MPYVSSKPIGLSNGDEITDFINVAEPTTTVWTYPGPQSRINFTNKGTKSITLTVGATTVTVNPGATVEYTLAFTTFSTTSAAQTQEFYARATAFGKNGNNSGGSSNRTVVDVTAGPYNAKGDGMSDDTAAFNQAIAAVPEGGTLLVPGGTYMINAGNPYNPLNNGLCIQLKSNITISMTEDTVLKAIPNNFNNYAILLLRDVDSVTIEGGTLVGERYAHTFVDPDAQGGMGVWLHAARNITIRDVTFKEFMGDGVYTRYHDTLGNTLHVSVENCTFRDNRRQGISICANDDFRVTNCFFYGTYGTGGHDPGAGIDIEPELGGSVKNVVIANNVFQNNKLGIQAQGLSSGVIDGNIFEANTTDGIYLADTAYYVVSDNQLFSQGRHGIYAIFTKDSTISGNVSFNNTGYGIYLLNECDRNVISNNRCYQNGQYGISLYNSDDNSVSGNNISNNALSGIDVENSTGNVLSNNKVTANTRSGINIYKVKDSKIDGNHIAGNLQHGITIKGDAVGDSSDITITGNDVKANGQEVNNFYHNIDAEGSVSGAVSNLTIMGNTCRAGSGTNKPQFAIYLSPNVAGTYLGVNDTRLGGVAGGVSDNGTGTITPDTGKPDPSIEYSPMGLPFRRTVSDAGVGSYAFAGLAYDLFDRADSTTSLGSMNAGGTYTPIGSAVAGIISNKAYFVTDVDGDTVINATDFSTANYAVTCTVSGDMTSFSNYRNPQLLAKYIDGNNFVRAYAMGNWFSLEAKVDGVNTDWGQIQLSFVNGTDYKFKVAVKDGNVKMYLDGVLKIEYNMSPAELTKFGTNKKIGMRMAKSGVPTSVARFNNLVVEAT